MHGSLSLPPFTGHVCRGGGGGHILSNDLCHRAGSLINESSNSRIQAHHIVVRVIILTFIKLHSNIFNLPTAGRTPAQHLYIDLTREFYLVQALLGSGGERHPMPIFQLLHLIAKKTSVVTNVLNQRWQLGFISRASSDSQQLHSTPL